MSHRHFWALEREHWLEREWHRLPPRLSIGQTCEKVFSKGEMDIITQPQATQEHWVETARLHIFFYRSEEDHLAHPYKR